jgi:6-phosphofructokinase 1
VASRWSLGILTSGGDAPGMNAAIWAACERATSEGVRVFGIRDGFRGLLERRWLELDPDLTLPWGRSGGTRLGTSRLDDFPHHRPALDAALDALTVDRLLVLGGNGSLGAAGLLAERRPVVGVPATIDNDVDGSDASIGFATAVDSGLAQLDAIRDSAEALPRAFALETLGGATGYLAAAVAEAGAADVALVPEAPLAPAELLERVRGVLARRGSVIIVASEGYPDLERVLHDVGRASGTRVRASRLGHAQRGGRPNAADRRLAHALAREAVGHLAEGRSGRLVWQSDRAVLIPYGADPTRRTVPRIPP